MWKFILVNKNGQVSITYTSHFELWESLKWLKQDLSF